MSLIKTYPFTTAGNYNLGTAVTITSGKAELGKITTTGLSFNEDFATSASFTYSTTAAEFSGGQVQQVDQKPSGFIAGALYSFRESLLSYSAGTLTGTKNGGVTLTGGFLTFDNTTTSYYEVTGGANTTIQQTGCVNVRYKPAYSGNPLQNQFIMSVNNNRPNYVYLVHAGGSSNLNIFIGNSSKTDIMFNAATFSPNAGQEYEFELNFNVSTGLVEFYIDGTRTNQWTGVTGTRSDSTGSLMLGRYINNITLDGDISRFALYDTVQHTGASYTPGTLSSTQYAETKVDLPAFTDTGSVTSFSSFTISSTGTPKFTLNNKYYDGTGWTTSAGTFAQANTKADVDTNINAFTGVASLTVSAIFGATSSQSAVADLTVGYNGFAYPQTDVKSNVVETFNADTFVSFSATASVSGSDLVKYIMKVGTQLKYWDGAAWSDSDGTYSQANTAAEINSNASSLSLTITSTLQLHWLLHSDDGTTTPQLDQVVITYDRYNAAPTLSECIIHGYVYDNQGDPITDATVEVDGDDFWYDSALVSRSASTTTDSTGSWEVGIVETVSDSTNVIVTISYDQGNKTIYNRYRNVIIPNTVTAALSTLI